MLQMPRLSDIIENFIKEMFLENEETELQIKRNELASYFSCAPSQINYVLTTRFTKDKGYYIESKRGGGGCIIIRRVEFNDSHALKNVLNTKIGNSITYDGVVNIIDGLIESEFITEREGSLIKVSVNDRVLSDIVENKNEFRANMLKSMLMIIL
ncbi:CtsR family transcriptional regulator [Clostridium niameyense]|uniref:CtsR family transcriptional regulator n=1 Tax=Clostridium niameyense TaxID=1622073 RepID=UPI00101AE8AE|nr:CtsR family transcriptional regulator [Clostridium niameyense]